MKNSLRISRNRKEKSLIRIEIRISTEVEKLSGDTLDKIEHVIVTSVSNLIKESTKKVPTQKLISNLTSFDPNFKSESRYLVEVVSNSIPTSEE